MASTTQPKPANGSPKAEAASLEDLSNQIAILKKDIASLTSSLGSYGKATAENAADTARSTAQDLTEMGRLKAMETQIRAEEFVRTQPTTALGIAAGIGFLVGLVTARR